MSKQLIKKEWSFDFDFNIATGEIYGKFLAGLKDKKFFGNRCGGRNFFPPKPFCEKTLKLPEEWLECDGKGIVEAFTVAYEDTNAVELPQAEKRLKAPYVLAAIKIADSEQCLIHYLAGFDTVEPLKLLDQIKVGMQVEPVWAADRSGGILDIEYFKPLRQE